MLHDIPVLKNYSLLIWLSYIW